ncbi:hypothetical protein [Planctomicrobium sp. SH527]|uniref:hypothetical protein n=1 Tax=Planctomicrobium sp. SH527 TaxID=3448123 RepID=UPI003F5BE6C6
MGLVTVVLLMGMLVGTHWYKKGDQIELEEDYAKELATLKPPRVQILGPGVTPAQPSVPETAESQVALPAEVIDQTETEVPSDDSLESAGFAGKTLTLLQTAGITTVTDLKARIDSGEKIEGVGEKTLASILAQLDAAKE